MSACPKACPQAVHRLWCLLVPLRLSMVWPLTLSSRPHLKHWAWSSSIWGADLPSSRRTTGAGSPAGGRRGRASRLRAMAG
jgi:hypothetical protein